MNSQIYERPKAVVAASPDHEAEEVSIIAQWAKYEGGPWASISVGIDELLKLTSAVRRSTRTAQNLCTPLHFEVSDEENFRYSVRLAVRTRFSTARTSLTDQIGDTLHLRRRYLLYRQTHERKLRNMPLPQAQSGPLTPSHHAATAQTASWGDSGGSSAMTGKVGRKYEVSPPPVRRSVAGETDLSTPSLSVFQRVRNTPSKVSSGVFGQSKRQETHIDLQYPKIPPIAERKRSCYYCLKVLEDHITEKQWR